MDYSEDISNLYFGTDAVAVELATVENPQGVLVAEGLETPGYTPETLLDFDQTYYWRIEGVNVTDMEFTSCGVFEFTTEPYAYPCEDVNVIASHGYANPTVDGSGLIDGLAFQFA